MRSIPHYPDSNVPQHRPRHHKVSPLATMLWILGAAYLFGRIAPVLIERIFSS